MHYYLTNLFICALLFSNVIFGSSKRKSIEYEDFQNVPLVKKPSPTSAAHFFHDEQELPQQPLSTIYPVGPVFLEPNCTLTSKSLEFLPSYDDLFTDWWWLIFESGSSSSSSSSSLSSSAIALDKEGEQDAPLCIDSWNLDEDNYMSFDEEQEHQQQQQQGQQNEQEEQEQEQEQEEESVESSIDLFNSPDLDFD